MLRTGREHVGVAFTQIEAGAGEGSRTFNLRLANPQVRRPPKPSKGVRAKARTLTAKIGGRDVKNDLEKEYKIIDRAVKALYEKAWLHESAYTCLYQRAAEIGASISMMSKEPGNARPIQDKTAGHTSRPFR